jgi:hypothetical protein
MNIRLVLSGLAACAMLCAMPPIAGAKIFPMIFITNLSGSHTAAASPFGGSGTIDESVDFGQPQLLVQNLAMPLDIAVTDDIVYAVIGNKGIISAFSATSGQVINNGNVAAVPKGKPVGIAAFGSNVFVADFSHNTVREYTSAGGSPVLSFSQGINQPSEITASGGNLFVVNKGGKIGEYITEYDAATGQKLPGNLIQGLGGPIQITVLGTDLFILSKKTIDELDLTTGQLTKGIITGLNGATDIASFSDGTVNELFVTDVPNQSIDVYNIATGKLVKQINGLHGPQGLAILPVSGSVPDASSSSLLLLLGLIATFGLKVMVRQHA